MYKNIVYYLRKISNDNGTFYFYLNKIIDSYVKKMQIK